MEAEDVNHRAFMMAQQDGTLTQYNVPPGHYVGFVNGTLAGHHGNRDFLVDRMAWDYRRCHHPVYVAQV